MRTTNQTREDEDEKRKRKGSQSWGNNIDWKIGKYSLDNNCAAAKQIRRSVYKLISWYILDSLAHHNNDCHCLLSSPSDRLGLSNGRTKYRPPTRVFAQSNCKSEIQAEGKVHVKDSRKEHLFRPIILILISATTDADRPFVSHFHTAIRRDSILNSNQKFATSSATCGLLFPLTFSPVPDHELQPLQSTPPPFPTAHYNPSDSNAE